MNKRIKILIAVIAAALLISILSTTYAYFTMSNSDGVVNEITSGTMGLHLEDGPLVTLEYAIPGSSITKTFYVENTGSLATSYDIYLSEVINTFADKSDLVYEITSNDGGYNTLSPQQVPGTSAKIISSHPIGVGAIQHYTLKIEFLAKNENQDDNQGKEFSGKIQINEYKEAVSTSGKCYYVNSTFGDSSDLTSVGTKYECDPGDGIMRNFYILSENTDDVELLMERNITDGTGISTTTWREAIAYFDSGAGAPIKDAWTGVLDIQLPLGQQIVDAGGSPYWVVDNYQSGGVKFDPNADATHLSAYRWLFNYTNGCADYGCDQETSLNDGTYGYWTRDVYGNMSGAWVVSYSGSMSFYTCTSCPSNVGIRPVITVLKTNLITNE